MDISRLRLFQAAAKSEKLTEAAEAMHMSQPAFSASLAKLEKELGVNLFDRIGKRVRLNEYGEIYKKYVDIALDALDTAKKEIDILNNNEYLAFSLCSVSMQMIQNLMTDFFMAHPEAVVKRFEVYPRDVEKVLKNNESDVIINALPGKVKEAPGVQIIREDDIYLCVWKNHPLAKLKTVKLSELKNERFISLPEGYSFREMTEEFCKMGEFKCDTVQECFHCKMLSYVIDEIGVAFVTDDTVKREAEREKSEVAFVKIDDPNAIRTVILQWNPQRPLPKAAKSFIAFSKEYYAKTQEAHNKW